MFMNQKIAAGLLVVLMTLGAVVAFQGATMKDSSRENVTERNLNLAVEQSKSGFFQIFKEVQLKNIDPSPTWGRDTQEVIKIVRANVPPIEPTDVPSSKKGKKYDPSIESKLTEGKLSTYSISNTGKISGVKVRIYIDPAYFNGKVFKEALKIVGMELKARGAAIMDAKANPIVAVIPDKETLTAIESLQFVTYVRDAEIPLEQPTAGNVLSEGTYTVSAQYAWNKGYNGTGIRAGILDIYSGGFNNYQTLIAQGELPASTYLYTTYGTGISYHGSACGEVLYDVAPGIDAMFLGIYNDTWQMYNVTKWFIDNGVRVISHSISNYGLGPSQFDTNNDGIAEFWDVYQVIQYAIDNNVVWINSAGNGRLKHWEGEWKDQDGDSYLDIYGTPSASGIELDREGIQVILNSSVSRTFIAWIRWNDYPYPNGAPTNDFDAYLLCNTSNGWVTVAYSEDPQDGLFGEEPLEIVYFDLADKGWDDGTNRYCMLVIKEYNAPNADSMYFDVWWSGEAGYWYYSDPSYDPRITSGSVTPPGDYEPVITAGAVPWNNPTTTESFSAEGPGGDPISGTWLKPNVVAPDGVSTLSYAPYPFYGTSAAAPHTAGVAALVLNANSGLSPEQVKIILENTARDVGPAGVDYLTGYGLINASDATPQRIRWIYPTPHFNSIVDVQSLTINITTMYKQLNQSNLTFDGTVYEMTGSADRKSWWHPLTGLETGTYSYNVTTLDKFLVWTVQTYTRNFYVNLGAKNQVEGIDGDPTTAPGGTWASSETVAPDSSAVVDGIFVWKDANDAYTSPCTNRTYNITEVQLRADANYIYMLVKFADTLPIGTNPAPLIGVGFDTDNDNSIEYWAYAFLNKPGVGDGTPEFLDIYDSNWNNVAISDSTDTVFVAINNVVEMQIPRAVLGNPTGTIELAAKVYEGLGAENICSGTDEMTDNGNTIATVDLTQVPFFSNASLAVFIALLVGAYLSRTRK